MSNLIRGEFYKLRKSKYFVGMIFVVIAASFAFSELWYKDVEKIERLHHGIYSIEYAFFFIMVSSFIFAALAGDFIAKDFKNRNISKSFIYGYRRSEVILSKLIVFIIFSLFLELIYTTILVVHASIIYGFCEVLDFSTILYLVRVISIGIIYNTASISIIAIIAVVTKSNFFTFVSPVILLLAYKLSCLLINCQLPFSKIAFIHPYIAGELGIGINAPKPYIIIGIISPILIFIIIIAAGILYMKNADIK